MSDKYDFDRVGKLLNIVKQTADYPNLRDIGDNAMEELQTMIKRANEPQLRVVTPPEGPANSAIDNGDGTITRMGGEQPIPNAVLGKRDEVTGEPVGVTAGGPPAGEATALDHPSQPAPGVDGLTPEENPSDTQEEIDRKREDAANRQREALAPRDPNQPTPPEVEARRQGFNNPTSGQPVQPNLDTRNPNEIRREELNRTPPDQRKVPPVEGDVDRKV